MNQLAFELPSTLEAREPPEARGLARDEVRLLVADRATGRVSHCRFRDLVELLSPGDLLVVNVSATLPASIAAHRPDSEAVRVHFSTRVPDLDPSWRVIELRTADGSVPHRARLTEHLALAGGATLELVAPYAASARLLLARLRAAEPLEAYLFEHGEPIRYRYVTRRWPLTAYQNVYATVPGSAEMPSAGRPFTARLLASVRARGILIAPVTLHAGVSSPERDKPVFAEMFEVPESTARLVNAVRDRGGRVIAVGTTVVRALETVAASDGSVRAAEGFTSLVITPERAVRAVDGLITGWHEPAASHLHMLQALAGSELLVHSYAEALDHGYLWHEFGDSHLLL